MTKVAFLGAAALDTIITVDQFPRSDEIVFPNAINKYPGGSTANIAVGLKRLGIDTAFWGKVGDDEEGKIIIREFLNEGVDTDNIIIEKNKKSAGTFIAVNSSGERVIYSLGGTALFESIEEAYGLNFNDIKGVYIGEALPEIGIAVEERAKSIGAKIFYSPGGIFCKFGLEYLAEMAKGCDYMLLNLLEAETITNTQGRDSSVKKLLDIGVPSVIITEGKEGSGYYSKKSEIFEKAYAAKAVDTTGAGDSFTAGFIKGILTNFDINKSLKLGNACASIAIQRIGARSSMPSYKEVINLLNRS